MDLSEQNHALQSSAVPTYSGTKQKILELLGSGTQPSVVADAVGVDPSYVTQLLSQEDFARGVAQLRFERLQKASDLDKKYEDLELALVNKLEDVIPYMVRPGEILAAIRIINQTKRRGQGIAPTNVTQVNIVNLILPAKLVQKFRTNELNQVVEADGQRLTTIAANVLMKQIEGDSPSKTKEIENGQTNGQQTYLPAARKSA